MPFRITNLSKTYPNGLKALKSLNLVVANNVFGLLGSNAAGKSTLTRAVAVRLKAKPWS